MAKFLCLTSFVVAAAIVTLCSANGNDYQWGTIGASDKLMAKEVVFKPGFLGTVTTHNYVYQQVGAATPLKINAIKITDKKKFKGATAVVASGGVGSNDVTITFTSLRGSGIKSLVEIYGA